MNEAETRAEYIDPKLKQAGWGEVEDSKSLREFRITDGRIQTGGTRSKPEIYEISLKTGKEGSIVYFPTRLNLGKWEFRKLR